MAFIRMHHVECTLYMDLVRKYFHVMVCLIQTLYENFINRMMILIILIALITSDNF